MSVPPAAPSGAQQSSTARGQSGPLGITLVFGIMLAGAVMIVVFGAAAIGDTQNQLSTQRAEKVMTELDSEVALVALGRADSQQVTFARASGEQFTVENGSGWMRVNITDQATSTERELFNESLGAVKYENGNTVIAYQGGGVWRLDDGHSVMVSPPEFHYRNATLTLPLVTVTGDPSLGNTAAITKNGSTEQKFPDTARVADWENPLRNSEIVVTVRSEYYQAWGRYFETRTAGDVAYNHAKETASVRLVVPPNNPPVQGGVVAGAPGTDFVIKNGAEVDSFNSSVGDYSTTAGSNTRIVAAGRVNISNNAVVYGNIEVGRSLKIDNNGEIRHGNISYGDGIGGGGWDSGWTRGPEHWVAQNASVVSPDSVSIEIDNRNDEWSDPANNDNDAESDDIDDPDGPTPTLSCSGDCTLSAGNYYLSSMTVNQDLTLDATGGNVSIAIDGDLYVDNGVDIDVNGDGRVNIYLAGDSEFRNNARVLIAGDNSTRFWLYMHPDRKLQLWNGVEFRGVVYGPGVGTNPGADLVIEEEMDVYGGLVGDVEIQANNAEIHYDEALANTKSIVRNRSIPSITYLHVSINRVHVTD